MISPDILLEKIRKNDPKLIEVSLSASALGDNGAKILAKALEKNTVVQSLELGNGNIGPEGAKALAAVLKNSRNLKTIYLRGNRIGDVGAQAFAEALKINKSLEHLYLGNNKITIEGAKYFAEALTQNSTLQTIYLRNNKITDAGVQILSDALVKNFGLCVINFANAELTEVGCNVLLKLLDQNTTLQSVIFEHNGVESPEIVNAFTTKFQYNQSLAVTTSNNIAKKVLAHIEEHLAQENSTENLVEKFSLNRIVKKVLARTEEQGVQENPTENLVEKFSLSRSEKYHYSGNNLEGNAILCVGFLSRMIFGKYSDKNSCDDVIKNLHSLYESLITRAKQDLENPQTKKPNQQILEAAKKIISTN